MRLQCPTDFTRRRRRLLGGSLALIGALFAGGCFGNTPTPPPTPAPATPSEPVGLRIGVVRLQAVVDHYDRYIYVTARFSEDCKKQYQREADALARIEEELKKQDNLYQNTVQMLVDEKTFQDFLAKGEQLHSKEIDARLLLRATRKLKDDLNTVMIVAVMEDIQAVIADLARERDFDYVIGLDPLPAADHADDCTRWLDNAQERAPVFFATAPLDITAEVQQRVNAGYAATYAAR